MISKPQETYLADTYRFTYVAEGVDIILDRFIEERDGLKAELLVTTNREPAAGLLRQGKINLSSPQSKATAVKALKMRATTGFLDDVDFDGIIEQICYRSLARWREGDPFVNLRTVDFQSRSRWLLEPFVEFGGPTVLFAKGGSGKSMFALAIAVSIATGQPLLGMAPTQVCPVLYLDWEADEFTHAERLAAICDGYGIAVPDLLYRRGVASLAEGAPSLRRNVAANNIGCVVFDSVGAARGGDPASAELTIKLFTAVRSFGIPALGIDHITKDANSPKENPFGSVYTTNMARITWRMETIQAEGSDEAAISLTNMKVNNGRPAKRRGYRAFYESDQDDRLISARWELADLRTLPEFTSTLSQRDQIIAVLQGQGRAMHPNEIVAALSVQHNIEMEENTVRAVLSAGAKDSPRAKAVFVRDAGAKGLWGLMTRREA